MAASSSTAKGTALAAVVTVIVLATTGVWNPFPAVWGWIDTREPIAPGVARWQAAIGGSPRSVTFARDTVVVEYRTSVEAYGLGAGVRLWKSDADWAAVAGDGDDAVVVTGKLLTKGYQVLEPRTGAVRRSEPAATAVWTYANAVLDLRCAQGDECRLTAWDPRGSRPLWTVDTGGIGFVLDAANPDLPDTRGLTSPRVAARAGGPQVMPGLLGLPDDGRVRVVDTASGRIAQIVTPRADQRVAVTGGRVLTVTGAARDGTCYFDVAATDPPSARVLWSRAALNLRTADDGSACRQEHDPAGGNDVVLGVDPVGREELVSAHDGRRLWHGERDQSVLAVDDRYAIVRGADRRTFTLRSFRTGRAAWRRGVNPGATAALTPYAALVLNTRPARLTALSPSTGAVLTDARTDAEVLATGPDGLIVVSGRDMAYLPFR